MVRLAEQPPLIEDVTVLAAAILRMRREPPGNALLVGVSGVDVDANADTGSALARALEEVGLRVARVRDAGWHNLPRDRFHATWPALHYYDNALRLDEMFDEVIVPLTLERSVHVVCGHADETSREFRPESYDFDNIDVVLVESIFLFKRARRSLFDLALWVDTTFEHALDRAVNRCAEPPEPTVRAYETIYFPAQRIHLKRDQPHRRADVVCTTSRQTASTNGRMATMSTEPSPSIFRARRFRRDDRPRTSETHQHWDETLIRLPL
jgi:uridine kinase